MGGGQVVSEGGSETSSFTDDARIYLLIKVKCSPLIIIISVLEHFWK